MPSVFDCQQQCFLHFSCVLNVSPVCCIATGAALGGGKMYHVQASKETLNEGLLLIKGTPSSTDATTSASAGRLSDCLQREAQLEFWLKVSVVCGAVWEERPSVS